MEANLVTCDSAFTRKLHQMKSMMRHNWMKKRVPELKKGECKFLGFESSIASRRFDPS
jgi:hypothetical protein